MDPEEIILARGLERARMLVRALAVPDQRVQIAAARVLIECGDRVTAMIEEIARTEEETPESEHSQGP